MNIGIDIDGVIADIEPYIFEYGAKLLYDKGRTLDDIKRKEYETYEIFKWDRDTEHEFWDNYMLEYYKNAPARAFASEVIKKLKEQGHNIYIITARGISEKELYSYLKDITKKWLKENDIYYDEIFFEKDKKKIIQEYDIDIMIEDYAKNIRNLEAYCEIIVFDCIYNQNVHEHNRVNSWYEILYLIENNKVKRENRG
mgnify:FL=1